MKTETVKREILSECNTVIYTKQVFSKAHHKETNIKYTCKLTYLLFKY